MKTIIKCVLIMLFGFFTVIHADNSNHTVANKDSSKVLLFKYSDFGPQVSAYEIIGFEWWQWNSHGDPDPHKTYNIKVVVYKDIPLETVEAMFPVNKKLSHDYRYLKYETAIIHFNYMIEEFAMFDVKRFKKLKEEIISFFENKETKQ